MEVELEPIQQSVERRSAPGPASNEASSPEIEQALLSIAARFPAPTGDEALGGRVIDEAGGPIEGATVFVTGPRSERDMSMGARAPAEIGRGYDGERRINPLTRYFTEGILHSLTPAGSSATDADGRFSVEGLATGMYQVEVLAEDFIFDRASGEAGDTLEVVGKAVTEFELSVLDASGSPPAEATIVVRENNGLDQSYMWTPDAPELRVASRLVTLQAFVGEVTRVGQGEYRADARTSLQAIDRDVDGPGPHLLQLKSYPSVHIDVIAGPDAGQPFEPWCELVRGEQRISAKQLPGKPFAAFDVTPGPYTVEVGRGDGPAEATREITVDTGQTQVSIELGALDPKRYLIVHCVDAGGRSVQDIRSFGASLRIGRKSWGTSIRTKARSNGEYWLSLERDIMGREMTPRASITEMTLIARSPTQGEVRQEIDPQAERLELVFQKSCELLVKVDGVLRPELRVSVEVPKEEGEGWQRKSQPSDVPGDGSVGFQSLAPGSARVVLGHSDSPWGVHLAVVPVELQAGKNEVKITAPETYSLVVLVPGLEDKRFDLLTEDDGEFVRAVQVEADGDDRITFQNLPPGRFRVQYRGRFGPIFADYVVPCGDVLFEPSQIEGFEVLSVSKGSVSELAGLRAGDVLLGVDHIGPTQESFVLEYTKRVIRPEGTVLKIRRAGKVLELQVRLDEPPKRSNLGLGARFKTLGQ